MNGIDLVLLQNCVLFGCAVRGTEPGAGFLAVRSWGSHPVTSNPFVREFTNAVGQFKRQSVGVLHVPLSSQLHSFYTYVKINFILKTSFVCTGKL